MELWTVGKINWDKKELEPFTTITTQGSNLREMIEKALKSLRGKTGYLVFSEAERLYLKNKVKALYDMLLPKGHKVLLMEFLNDTVCRNEAYGQINACGFYVPTDMKKPLDGKTDRLCILLNIPSQ